MPKTPRIRCGLFVVLFGSCCLVTIPMVLTQKYAGRNGLLQRTPPKSSEFFAIAEKLAEPTVKLLIFLICRA